MKPRKERHPQTTFNIGITTGDLFENVTILKHDALAGRLFAILDALEKGDDKAIKKIAAESRAKAFRALADAAMRAATDQQARDYMRAFVREALDEAFRWSRYRVLAQETWEQHVRKIRSNDAEERQGAK